jgi:hypothetical protein
MFRRHKPNQTTEVRRLEKRNKGKSNCVDENGEKVGTKVRTKARTRMRIGVRAKVEWVPGIYLAVINK